MRKQSKKKNQNKTGIYVSESMRQWEYQDVGCGVVWHREGEHDSLTLQRVTVHGRLLTFTFQYSTPGYYSCLSHRYKPVHKFSSETCINYSKKRLGNNFFLCFSWRFVFSRDLKVSFFFLFPLLREDFCGADCVTRDALRSAQEERRVCSRKLFNDICWGAGCCSSHSVLCNVPAWQTVEDVQDSHGT